MLCSFNIMFTINAMKISENYLEIQITLTIYSFITVRGARKSLRFLCQTLFVGFIKKQDSFICEN